jgi:AraC-like DNA-binding protein
MITHLLHEPAAPLGCFVENMWLVRGRQLGKMRQMLLPDGALSVMFNLGEPQRLCEPRAVERHAVFRASWVSGLQPKPIVIEQAGECHLVGIRFQPGGAFPLFRVSLAELTGRVVELEDIWGAEAERVREQLNDCREDAAKLRCLERRLERRLRPEAKPDDRVFFATQCLQAGGTGVGWIAEQVAWSHKHFVHEFTRRVGLAPKQYGRVQRLQRAIRRVAFQGDVDWADVALANGFYDQAHLINEFRDLAGMTPTEYAGRRSPYLGYLSVS